MTVAPTVCALAFATLVDVAQMPTGTPAQQVAAVRARLDAARAEFVKKVQAASSNADRDRLMRQAPNSDKYARLMLRVVGRHPTDPAALDGLLWVVGNTPPGGPTAANTRAKATILKDHLGSDRLAPFAVALSWSASAADEDALRKMLVSAKSDAAHGTAGYALALQLLAQAEMSDLHRVRVEVAADAEAKRRVRESLDEDFGKPTADRLRAADPTELRAEAEKLLAAVAARKGQAAAEWPTGVGRSRLGPLAERELEAVRTLAPGRTAPETTGEKVGGGEASLAGLRGNAVLLTFSGHWCAACRRLYPQKRELGKTYAARPFRTLEVNSDASRDTVTKAAGEEAGWPVIWDGGSTEGPLATRWNVRGWPLVVLVDHAGVIRYKFRGAPEPAILAPLVEKLVAEAEAAGRKK